MSYRGQPFNEFNLTQLNLGKVKTGYRGYPFLILEEVYFPPVSKYTVTFSSLGNGTLIASTKLEVIESGDQLKRGTTVTFLATPNQGYRIKEWKVNGQKVIPGKPNNILIIPSLEKDLTVTIEFKETIIIIPDILDYFSNSYQSRPFVRFNPDQIDTSKHSVSYRGYPFLLQEGGLNLVSNYDLSTDLDLSLEVSKSFTARFGVSSDSSVNLNSTKLLVTNHPLSTDLGIELYTVKKLLSELNIFTLTDLNLLVSKALSSEFILKSLIGVLISSGTVENLNQITNLFTETNASLDIGAETLLNSEFNLSTDLNVYLSSGAEAPLISNYNLESDLKVNLSTSLQANFNLSTETNASISEGLLKEISSQHNLISESLVALDSGMTELLNSVINLQSSSDVDFKADVYLSSLFSLSTQTNLTLDKYLLLKPNLLTYTDTIVDLRSGLIELIKSEFNLSSSAKLDLLTTHSLVQLYKLFTEMDLVIEYKYKHTSGKLDILSDLSRFDILLKSKSKIITPQGKFDIKE
jgi:hypothetical protein